MHSSEMRILAKAMGEALFDSVLAEIAGRELGGPPHRAPDFFRFCEVLAAEQSATSHVMLSED
jgi:hypothetical protein